MHGDSVCKAGQCLHYQTRKEERDVERKKVEREDQRIKQYPDHDQSLREQDEEQQKEL